MHRPDRSPSQRFRFEHYLPYFESQGVECHYSFIINEADDRVFYAPGNLSRKAWVAGKGLALRLFEAVPPLLSRRFDLVFVQREAYFVGGAMIEKLMARSDAKLVYDFDDAIWIPGVSAANKRFAFLRAPNKIGSIVAQADRTLVGNRYLADFARRFSDQVSIVPTTVDTRIFHPRQEPKSLSRPVCIGWSGSFSTIPHFERIVPVLVRLRERYGDRIEFKVIGDSSYRCTPLSLAGEAWSRDGEVARLQEIDIGLMPLPDDRYARGKCGFKGLLYMSVGIPALMAPVGVNAEIVTDRVNGFLPDTDQEWFDRLCELVEDDALRRQIGEAGRTTAVERYSVEAWQEPILHHLQDTLLGRRVES